MFVGYVDIFPRFGSSQFIVVFIFEKGIWSKNVKQRVQKNI